jgi:hypothetical protein
MDDMVTRVLGSLIIMRSSIGNGILLAQDGDSWDHNSHAATHAQESACHEVKRLLDIRYSIGSTRYNY